MPNTSHTVPNSKGVTGGSNQRRDRGRAWAQCSWQNLFYNRQFCHLWQEVGRRILPAMTTAIILLLLVALIVFLSMITPSGGSFLDHEPVDRDLERQIAELRAHH